MTISQAANIGSAMGLQDSPYRTAARLYGALTGRGWDRDEAAEVVDWLLGRGHTRQQKEELLQDWAGKNDIRLEAN